MRRYLAFAVFLVFSIAGARSGVADSVDASQALASNGDPFWFSFGVEAASRYGAYIALDEVFKSENLDEALASVKKLGASSTAVSAGFSSDSFEFLAKGALALGEDGAIRGELSELWLGIVVLDFLSLRIGRFPYHTGNSEFFSSVDFFSRSQPERILSGGGVGYLPSDLVQARIFAGDFFAAFTLLPLKPEMVSFDLRSIWFPKASFPRSFIVPVLGFEVPLRSIGIAHAESGWTIDDMGYSVELGARFGPADLSLTGFFGWDPRALYRPEVYMPEGFSYFDVILNPVYEKILALAFSSILAGEDFRFWLDGSFSPNRGFLLRSDTIVLKGEIAELPSFDAVAGLSYELPAFPLIAFAEWREIITLTSLGIHEPFLGSAVAAGISASLIDPGLRLSLVSLISPVRSKTGFLDSPGWMVAMNLMWVPSLEYEFSLTIPVFGGDRSTPPGEYSNILYVNLTAALKL